MLFLKDRSIGVSRPKAREMHGVKIQKMPVGRYLDVMQGMGGILADLLDVAFPGKTPGQIIQDLTIIKPSEFRDIAVRLLAVLPDEALRIISSILGVELKHVREQLTPNELMEVWAAFWEMNDLSSFFLSVRKALPAVLSTAKPKPGGSSD